MSNQSDGMSQIDPRLISANDSVPSFPPLAQLASNIRSELAPAKDADGNITESSDDFKQKLLSIKAKLPLQTECTRLKLKYPKSATLERLRSIITEHCFLTVNSADSISSKSARSLEKQPVVPACIESQPSSPSLLPAFALASQNSCLPQANTTTSADVSSAEEIALVKEFGSNCNVAGAAQVLGYDKEVEEEEEEEYEDGYGDDKDSDPDRPAMISDSPETYKAYQTKVRVEAAHRAEGDRHTGGIRTQKAMVRAWDEFVTLHQKKGQIKDNIVDEHSLLLYIQYSAERPKRNRRGVDIPGTYIGASQLKKQFFGALHIRKEQDAADISLAATRRATSVGVWDALKNRMNEALERTRNGLMLEEDAPDIIANTFLAEITKEELDDVGKAFLLHCAINGHLAWTIQHATGNRGDDLRALKLSELQPWQFLHPNQETSIYTVLGLQGEEKARRRGMRTTINPVYTSLIAHERPEKCLLGALAFFLHHIYNVQQMAAKENIDWSLNKSWRQIRLLHSSTSYTAAYSAQCLYNLYVRAFTRAGLNSRLKLHLACHILGYLQEALGVDGRETSKLGWKRGETYSDVYSPALPKTAILACHGYKEHETYDPIWHHVHVPKQFLQLMCPGAEGILGEVRGEENLWGTTGHWDMVIALRPYLFQCGAAIYHICPESSIFKLPALAHQDVRNWMVTTFRTNLAVLKANAGDPVNLQRLKDRTLQLALEELRVLQSQTSINVKALSAILLRRTAVLSPTKNFSNDMYYQTAQQELSTLPWAASQHTASSEPTTPTREAENATGTYQARDSSFRAFVNDSPTNSATRAKTQVDLVLPHLKAFQDSNVRNLQLLWPPILGQKGVSWTNVFKLVKQPKELWEKWKPTRSMDQYGSVEALWNIFNEGEAIYSDDGLKTGMKPPLNLVEKFFGSTWRTTSNARKVWSRMREIPDWVDICSSEQNISPSEAMAQLETMRVSNEDNGPKLGLNALSKQVKQLRIQRRQRLGESTLDQDEDEDEGMDVQMSSDQTSGSSSTRKRRAAPLDPRKKPKPKHQF